MDLSGTPNVQAAVQLDAGWKDLSEDLVDKAWGGQQSAGIVHQRGNKVDQASKGLDSTMLTAATMEVI